MGPAGSRNAIVKCPNCGHPLASVEMPEATPATLATSGPALLRVSEAAAFLAISRTSAYQLINAGKIPVVRIGSSVGYRERTGRCDQGRRRVVARADLRPTRTPLRATASALRKAAAASRIVEAM
jgi:excisionase family DNA binding protein